MGNNDAVATTKEYYDSHDADNFYYQIWGGEDIHVGIYEYPEEDIFTASNRTVRQMVSIVKDIDENTKVLDVGAGYGGAARYLASQFKCHVTCLNLSETENERNRQKNESQNLTEYIDVRQGNFEEMPFEDAQFDIAWSEEAILHSGNKPQVFKEVARVLRKGGHFIFTDPMQSDDSPDEVLQPILDRIHLKDLGSVQRYRELAKEVGLEEVLVNEMPEQLTRHYSNVQKELRAQYDKLAEVCSTEYLDKMDKGLSHWVDGGQNGHLSWGILLFKKQ